MRVGSSDSSIRLQGTAAQWIGVAPRACYVPSMKVIVFGASGMIGQGVLRECLLADDVSHVLSIGRTTAGVSDPKLEEILHPDFTDFSKVEDRLGGYDACFYCLGASSSGMSEADYTRVTYDYTVAAGEAVARQSPGLVFCFVSGGGTDATEKGRTMWARVKGRAENAVSRAPQAPPGDDDGACRQGNAQGRPTGRTARNPGKPGDQRAGRIGAPSAS